MDELETRMREVLLQLALTSNGRTASFDAGGGADPDWTPRLDVDDAPHLYFARRWDSAATGEERAKVLEAAQERLRHARRSSGVRTAWESKKDRDTRIVNTGEGVAAAELAVHFRCGVSDIRKARHAAGLETEYGRSPRNGRELSAYERHVEVLRLHAQRMSARDIARALQLSYSTVLRELDRKA